MTVVDRLTNADGSAGDIARPRCPGVCSEDPGIGSANGTRSPPRRHTRRKHGSGGFVLCDRSKTWGGAGLGPHELNKVIEIIAGADVSTAWVTGFYNFHNWFLCRYPQEVQEGSCRARLGPKCSHPVVARYSRAHRRSLVGERTLGLCNRDVARLRRTGARVVDGEMCLVIMPREKLEIIDDWEVAAMAATGSVTIVAKDADVPRNCALAFGKICPRPTMRACSTKKT